MQVCLVCTQAHCFVWINGAQFYLNTRTLNECGTVKRLTTSVSSCMQLFSVHISYNQEIPGSISAEFVSCLLREFALLILQQPNKLTILLSFSDGKNCE